VSFAHVAFRDEMSLLPKLDPGTWPKRHRDIECRPSHDEIAQATKDFVSCRFNPNNLETQLAKLSHLLASSDFALPSLDCGSCRAGARLFTFSTTTGFVRPWL
jgi:hypothetical protein